MYGNTAKRVRSNLNCFSPFLQAGHYSMTQQAAAKGENLLPGGSKFGQD